MAQRRVVAAEYFVLNNSQFNVNVIPGHNFTIYLDNIEQRLIFPTLPSTDVYIITSGGTHILAGDYTFTGTIQVPAPISPADAATKSYVDNVVIGLDYKDAAHLGSNSNVSLSGSTPLSIDSITVVNGWRLLLFGQSAPEENGIYDANIGPTTYTLTRSPDAIQGGLNKGTFIFVTNGALNGYKSYVLNTEDPIIVDTTPLNFVVFSGGTAYTAGNGLQLVANTFSVDTTISTESFVASTSVSTPTITSPVSTIGFSSKNLTNVASITSPLINQTGTTSIGNALATASITGSTISLVGPTSASSLSTDTSLSFGVGNQITISPSGVISAAKSYSLPVSSGSTATIPLVSGAAASSPSAFISSGSHIGSWTPTALPVGSITTYNSSSTGAQTAATFSTTTDTTTLFSVKVTARVTSTGDSAVYSYVVMAKNAANILTLTPAPYPGMTSFDPAFGGSEVAFSGSAANFLVRVSPPSSSATVWKVWIEYYA